MKKLLSTKYSAGAFNFAMLVLRFGLGVLMANHGFQKLSHFAAMKTKFMSFMGLGATTSLCLVIFAEFFCSIFLILGLFTRLATVPLIIAMGVAVFMAHKGEIFGDGEHGLLFLIGYIVLLFVGPGKISVDGMTGK